MHLALKTLNVKKGDTVLCSTFTFAATAFAVSYVGAVPVFIDAEQQTWNMCPLLLEEAILKERKQHKNPAAILLVHSFGVPAQMDKIVALSEKYAIPLIEDAAAALGSDFKGKKCGTFGTIGVFSFNANKILTSGGGGALVSNEKELILKANYLAAQAKSNKDLYYHKDIGYNYAMSNVNAAIGAAQMEEIEKILQLKSRVFNFYNKVFESNEALKFFSQTNSSNKWLNCILASNESQKEFLRRELNIRGIQTRQLWYPMHLQPVFHGTKYYGEQTAKTLYQRGIAIPSSCMLSTDSLERIASALVDL